jgi:hypothetical protein
MAYYRIIPPASSIPPMRENTNFMRGLEKRYDCIPARIKCDDAATRNPAQGKDAAGISRKTVARINGFTQSKAVFPEPMHAFPLDAVMNIFLQKRRKFENLAFTYSTYEKARVTIRVIA